MPKPVTPLVGCDVFVLNEDKKVLLVKRSDNLMWCLPGGCHDLGETPRGCAERECFEESGYVVECTDLIGVYSSNCYEYKNYPFPDTEFTHILFFAKIKGGNLKTSEETIEVNWFAEDEIPELSDGHENRIKDGFNFAESSNFKPYFE